MNSITDTPNEPLAPSPGPENILMIGSGELDPGRALTELRMPSGEVIRVATALLISPPEVSLQQEELLSAESDGITVPLIGERLEVGVRTVQTAKIRLQKTVQEYQEELNEPLAVRTFQVERVALNQLVDEPPAVRQEGDTTVYPVVEEQLILTKQLILKEEVRVTKVESERLDTQVVTLRREHLSVERTPV